MCVSFKIGVFAYFQIVTPNTPIHSKLCQNRTSGSCASFVFNFWETSILFSTVAAPTYILSNSAWGFLFLHILANYISWRFGFVFPWWLGQMSVGPLHILFGKMYIQIFCLFFPPTLHSMHNFPNQGSNLCPLQWKYGVSTTGLMEKSYPFFKIRFIFF